MHLLDILVHGIALGHVYLRHGNSKIFHLFSLES